MKECSLQRFFDLTFSAIALVVLLPLFLVISLILRLSGEGEILFSQYRVGKHGNKFKLYKFVTMVKNSPNIGTGTITLKNDPRVLPFGRLLRSTKINELPQLFNVLIGDMSVVGPRPQEQRCFSLFPPDLQKIIVQAKPGLSGIASILFRSEETIISSQPSPAFFYAHTISPYKGRVEEWYVKNQTIYIYFAIILLTIWVVIFPNTTIIWRVFKDIPKPPIELRNFLKHKAY